MTTTNHLREKYKPKPFGNNGRTRFPAGGEDVLRACQVADNLERIIRELQHQQPPDIQNDIERKLWAADA